MYSDAETRTGAGVLVKVQGMNRRLLAVILALVFVLTVVPATVWLVVKGASAAEGSPLNSVTNANETGNSYTYTVLDGGLPSGPYNISYGGRTYVFDLDFRGEGSRLEEPNNDKLNKGDTLVFDTTTKKLTWTYNPENTGIVDASSEFETPIDENGTLKFVLNNGADATSQLVKDKTYYLEQSGIYYLFSVEDDVIGYQAGDTIGNGDYNIAASDYWYKRKLEDPQMINSSESPLNIIIQKENGEAVLAGDQLKRRQIYMSADAFQDGHVYLIRDPSGNLLSASTTRKTTTTGDKMYQNYHEACVHTGSHHYYEIELNPVTQKVYGTTNEHDFHNLNGQKYNDDAFVYYDGEDSEDALVLSELRAQLVENHTVVQDYDSGFIGIGAQGFVPDTNNQYNAFYLFGYDQNGETGANRNNSYTSEKTLGQIANDTFNRVTFYDLCEGVSRFRVSLTYGGYDTKGLNHNDDSLWVKDGSKLLTHFGVFTPGITSATYSFGTHYLSKNNNNYIFGNNNNAATFEIYERTSVYIAENDYQGIKDSSIDRQVTQTISARSVSYAETEANENGLELKKTVTDVGDGKFDVQLEAWTTSESLTQPETDIVLLLDTSRNMNNSLYDRQYTNLKTYHSFGNIALSGISHDKLFDSDAYPDLGFFNNIPGFRWLARSISSLFGTQREYKHNKYVEDPNAPGTYVYLHQEYSNTFDLTRFSFNNVYQYFFTSSNGVVYSTQKFSVPLLENVGTQDPINQLVFTAAGYEDYPVNTIYYGEDYYKQNENHATALNHNLKSIADSANGLYVDDDGVFRQVVVTENEGIYTYTVRDDNGNVKYQISNGGKTPMQGDFEGYYSGRYGVFQGFRHYKVDEHGDIVLDENNYNNLLSKSLYTRTNETVTGMLAMQEALEDFLLSAHYQAVQKKSTVNIALITYDKEPVLRFTLDDTAANYTYVNKSVGAQSIDNMVSAIYNYSTATNNTYASELGDAMTMAYNEVRDKSEPGNRRFGALFTAGVPANYTTHWFWGYDNSTATFDTSIADTAISYANRLKNEFATTMYTVGLFDNANETKIYGDYWYYTLFRDKLRCSGRAGSYWGGSWLSNVFRIDPKDAYAINRMLAYISSDSANVTSLGATRGRYSPRATGIISYLVTRGEGYRITNAYTPEETGYYLTVSPLTLDEGAENEEEAVPTTIDDNVVKTVLGEVFGKIQDAITIPNSKLDATATLMDGITQYFKLDETSNVEAYAADYTTGAKVADLTVNYPVNDPDDPNEKRDTLEVTGFNYFQHYVGSGSDQKAVLKFTIEREDDFIGGNDVPTNRPTSGVYDGEDILEERFDVPHVDVPIEMDIFTKNDAVYYGSAEYLPNLLEEKWFDGVNNAFVNIEYTFKNEKDGTINTYSIPAGSSMGTWDRNKTIQYDEETEETLNSEYIYYQMLNTDDFTIECNVDPSIRGTIGDEDYSGTSTVYVYQPHFDVHNDIVTTAPAQYPLYQVPELSWIFHDSEGVKLTGDALSEANGLIENKVAPDYSYNIAEVATPTTAVVSVNVARNNQGNYVSTYTPQNGQTTVTQRTDYIVNNVAIVPEAFSYEYEDIVTITYYRIDNPGTEDEEYVFLYSYDTVEKKYYNEDGTVADKDVAEAAISASGVQSEEESGVITRVVNRPAANASTNDDVSFLNTLDNIPVEERTPTMWADPETAGGVVRDTGEFTIKLNEHQVIIKNHTSGEEGSDFSDPQHKFPLTFTLMNGQTGFNGDVTFTFGTSTQEQTLTFTNGVATYTAGLADNEYITLKNVRDGYDLSITSSPQPADLYSFHAGAGADEAAAHQNVLEVDDETETTESVRIDANKFIDLTHHIGDIPTTGFYGSGSKVNPFIIAAIVVAVLGGAYVAYIVRRKSQAAE